MKPTIRRHPRLLAALVVSAAALALPARATTVQIDPAHNGVTQAATSNVTTAQVSCGTTATQIVAARAARALLSVVQTSTTDIYVGGPGVTTSTGHLLAGTKGASLTLPTAAALYCIVASGTATVTEAETY